MRKGLFMLMFVSTTLTRAQVNTVEDILDNSFQLQPTQSYGEFVIGLYPTTYIPLNMNEWNAYDRIFNIGNGASDDIRSDGFTLFKSGLAILPSVNNQLIDADETGRAIITKEYLELKVPTPPSTGNYRLISIDGKVQWVK